MDNNLNANSLLDQIKEAQKQKLSEYEDKCWFCESNKPVDKNKWATLHLTKPAPSRSYKVENTYNLYTSIPRCKRCFAIHTIKKIFNWIFGLMFVLPMFFTAIPYQLMYIAPNALIAGFIVYRLAILKFTKPIGYRLQYPPVLELKRQGYKRWWATMFTRQFQQ